MTTSSDPTSGEPTTQLVAELAELLLHQGRTLAVGESLTGGLLSGALTTLPGASAWFRGGVVTYATDTKASVLGVPPALLGEFGPVHGATAAAMARHARMLFAADIGLAITGVAGPEPQDGVPVGTMFVGLDVRRGPARVEALRGTGDRSELRSWGVASALQLAIDTIDGRE